MFRKVSLAPAALARSMAQAAARSATLEPSTAQTNDFCFEPLDMTLLLADDRNRVVIECWGPRLIDFRQGLCRGAATGAAPRDSRAGAPANPDLPPVRPVRVGLVCRAWGSAALCGRSSLRPESFSG